MRSPLDAAMDLSLSDAARALGKSDRQIRYLIQSSKLQAGKVEGRWVIASADLPLCRRA